VASTKTLTRTVMCVYAQTGAEVGVYGSSTDCKCSTIEYMSVPPYTAMFDNLVRPSVSFTAGGEDRHSQ